MDDFRFFRVGGCVRDELLGVKPKDIDLAVEAPSFEAMLEWIKARGCKVWDVNEGYFTVRAQDPEFGAADFVLCRKDGIYHDGRRPETVEVGTIFDDLARRDFTVNAMAFTQDGELLDPHGGQNDLKNNILRFVNNPYKRLEEDSLRAFRAMRFSVTRGFKIHHQTRSAILQMRMDAFADDFVGSSSNRIRDELFLCFSHSTELSLDALVEFPILRKVVLARGINLQPTLGKVRKEQD